VQVMPRRPLGRRRACGRTGTLSVPLGTRAAAIASKSASARESGSLRIEFDKAQPIARARGSTLNTLRDQTSNMFKLVAMQECGEKATEGYPAHFVFAVSVSVQGIACTVQLRRQRMEVTEGTQRRTVYQFVPYYPQYCNQSVHVCGLQ